MQPFTLAMSDKRALQLELLEKSPKYIILYLPLVTPLVALHPCHSFTSLLWQHKPSDPIAENDKKVLVTETASLTSLRNFHGYLLLVYSFFYQVNF